MGLDRASIGPETPGSDTGMTDSLVLERLPVAVLTCDAHGRVVRMNRKAAALLGDGVQSGADVFELLHLSWPDGEAFRQDEHPVAQILTEATPATDAHAAIRHRDGKLQPVSITAEALRLPNGALAGATVCLHPVAAMGSAIQTVKQPRDILSAIFDTTPECIKLVAEDGTLLEMNPAGLRMVGADGPADVIGTDILQIIAPEYRDEWRANHARICAGERVSWTFEIISRSGRRLHMETHATPFNLPSGGVAQLAITRDVGEQFQRDAEVRASERRLRAILESLPAAIYTTDATGTITFYNRAAEEFWGFAPEIGKAKWCGSWRLYWPDGRAMAHHECPMAVAIQEARIIRNAEAIVERPDGTRAYFTPFPTPLHDENGRMVGAINMLVDITDRKRSEEQQLLLINELNHRVKNTLATVQSIAAQTFRADDLNQSYRWFEGRLFALSKAHDLLTRRNWEGAYLHDILTQATAPMAAIGKDRIEFSGPEVQLPARLALSLAMTTHELCTNAAKYGALSNADGTVRIEWQISGKEGEERFILRWSEHRGPPVQPPKHRGFGTRLIERGLPHELGAEVQLSFNPTGLACDIRVPLGRLAARQRDADLAVSASSMKTGNPQLPETTAE